MHLASHLWSDPRDGDASSGSPAPRTPLVRIASATLALLIGVAAFSRAASAGFDPLSYSQCDGAHRVGLDSTAVGGSRQLGPGRGIAQTFRSDDTLIHAITIWLPGPSRSLRAPLRVMIARTDGSGRPRPEDVIAQGPALRSGVGDGIRPARFEFEFKPPISLPARGNYAVVLIADECEILSLLSTASRRSARATMWEVARRGCSSGAIDLRNAIDDRELLMQVEFCDRGTAARGHTWGEMKARYH